METAHFTIYNASAGAGKTYNLSKEYIKLLVATDNPLKFKEILAITFTNKAAAEMKLRILGYLDQFAKDVEADFFNDLQTELAVDATLIQKRAKNALQGILHNYSAFAIMTIDKFTHKLVKSFAHDMDLPVNFELEIDASKIAQESVDALLSKVGSDKRLDKAIVNYALDKASDDKSWDISRELYRAAQLLFQENDSPFVQSFKGKSIHDFVSLQQALYQKIADYDTVLNENYNQFYQLLADNGIETSDMVSSPATFFKNIAKRTIVNKDTFANHLMDGKKLYPKKRGAAAAAAIERITPALAQLHKKTKENYFQYKKYKNLLKEVTPLTVINEIQKEYVQLKESNNMLLLAEFNTLVSKAIKNEAAPYIYERIGAKYHHFFIDEFQDTSELQWQNLIPLIQDALQSEYAPNQSGTLLLVGDAKQAIYRFRGGKASQFIDLALDENPFFIDKVVQNLKTNYRSFDTIVTFTNAFFNFIKTAFSNKTHQKIYEEGNKQACNTQKGGYVAIDFVAGNNATMLDETYAKAILKNIRQAQRCDFEYGDIAILTRNNKQGIVIAQFLTENGVPIISSQTLLLVNNDKIKLLIALIRLSINSKNQEAQIAFLEQFFALQSQFDDRHKFYSQFIGKDKDFFEVLNSFDVAFDNALFKTFGLFDGASYMVHEFGLDQKNDVYVQYFLDLIFEFTQRYQSSWLAFLNYWEERKDSLSIDLPEGQNAIQIMTIHKSKGLEFPVVIFPYADSDIYKDQNQYVWLNTANDALEGFENLRFSDVKSLEHLDFEAQQKWFAYREALELDAINLLYVTLTRPVEQLYILAAEKHLSKDTPKTTYAEFFRMFLEHKGKWDAETSHFHFGELHIKRGKNKRKRITNIDLTETIIQPWQLLNNSRGEPLLKTITKDSQLWNTKQGEAIDFGNLIHKILEEVYTLDDIKQTVQKFANQGLELAEEKIITLLEKMVQHPQLAAYYHPNLKVRNECEINVPSGMLQKYTIIIDRLVFLNAKDVVIIDYKTGESKAAYKTQLNEYERVLKLMNYNVTAKLLLFLDLDTSSVQVEVV